MVFAHGFGCDQSMWRKVAPEFEVDHRVIRYDLVGAGGSDLSAYDIDRYSRLEAHAEDLVELCRSLDVIGGTFVGHSVSAMIGVLAHRAAPDVFSSLVLIGPSARYLDDDGYLGGFSKGDIDDLLEMMASNHLGWQQPLSTMVMAEDAPELREELEASFCRTRPDIAHHFAAVTFNGDNRADLREVTVPTLVIQTTRDAIAPVSAGEFVRDQISNSTWALIDGSGHCAHLSAPAETIKAIREFLST